MLIFGKKILPFTTHHDVKLYNLVHTYYIVHTTTNSFICMTEHAKDR